MVCSFLTCCQHCLAKVRDYGMVVVSREGSNPEKFIYNSDLLTKYRYYLFLKRHNCFSAKRFFCNIAGTTFTSSQNGSGMKVTYIKLLFCNHLTHHPHLLYIASPYSELYKNPNSGASQGQCQVSCA